MLVESAKALSGGEVHDKYRVRALAGAVRDVRGAVHAIACLRSRGAATLGHRMCRVFGWGVWVWRWFATEHRRAVLRTGASNAKIEAHVIQVAVGAAGFRQDQDRLYDLIGFQVDGDQLGTFRNGVFKQRRSRVERPETVFRVDHHRLHTDEVDLVRVRVRKGVGVGQLAAGPVVDLRIGVGHRLALHDLGHGKRDVITPSSKVHEDTPGVRDGHALGHGPGEGSNGLKLAGGLVRGDSLRVRRGRREEKRKAEQERMSHRCRRTAAVSLLLAIATRRTGTRGKRHLLTLS